MKWDTIQLGEVIDVKHGFAFKSQYFAESGELVLLTPGNCRESGGLKLKGDKEKYYVGEFPPEFLLVEGDMLVVMTDLINIAPILGGSFLIPENNRFLHNQRLGLVRITDASRIDKTFLYYLLNTYEYRAQVRGYASGATVRHTSPGRIRGCKVRVPRDVSYQHQVGAILSAYDDLIENNRRRMALLEEAARQLYREWFVRLRFPGHEHTRIIRGMPEGWERVRICDFGDVITGKTPSTRERDNYGGDILFIKTPNMHGNVFVTETETCLTEKGTNSQPGKFIPPHAILVSCIGTIGIVSMTSERSQFNQQINAVVPFDDLYRYYCFFAFKNLRQKMEAIGGGVTMGNVNKTKFEGLGVLKPAMALLRGFHDFSLPLFQQILALSIQNAKLRAARDLLLPRLMSGAIAV
jgi:type I restriction enzyme S subunit